MKLANTSEEFVVDHSAKDHDPISGLCVGWKRNAEEIGIFLEESEFISFQHGPHRLIKF
jgi:hypothetical protein